MRRVREPVVIHRRHVVGPGGLSRDGERAAVARGQVAAVTCGAVAGRGAPAAVKRDSENAVRLEVAAAHSYGAAHDARLRIQAGAWGDGVTRHGRVVETQYGSVPAVVPRRHDVSARACIRDGESTVAE